VLLGEAQEYNSQGCSYRPGSPLTEAPEHESAQHLVQLADERDEWRFWR
jgi:hypothetical protein